MKTVTNEMLIQVLKKLRVDTRQEVIRITPCDDSPKLFESKYGGLPYLPRDAKPPVDKKGRALRLLAQINFLEVPANDYLPTEGILQFWILNDDFAGVDFDRYTTSDTSRIIYWEKPDLSVTIEEISAKYQPYITGKVDYFPVENELRLKFLESIDPISVSDYRFGRQFTKCLKSIYPDCGDVDFYELNEEQQDLFYKKLGGYGHKLLGYPMFTQEDPRGFEDGLEKYDTLLLQIESDGTDECEIMWGDCGVGNFFISGKDLKKRDFSKVIYTWDCC